MDYPTKEELAKFVKPFTRDDVIKGKKRSCVLTCHTEDVINRIKSSFKACCIPYQSMNAITKNFLEFLKHTQTNLTVLNIKIISQAIVTNLIK